MDQVLALILEHVRASVALAWPGVTIVYGPDERERSSSALIEMQSPVALHQFATCDEYDVTVRVFGTFERPPPATPVMRERFERWAALRTALLAVRNPAECYLPRVDLESESESQWGDDQYEVAVAYTLRYEVAR